MELSGASLLFDGNVYGKRLLLLSHNIFIHSMEQPLGRLFPFHLLLITNFNWEEKVESFFSFDKPFYLLLEQNDYY
jgi:hypothetical protein